MSAPDSKGRIIPIQTKLPKKTCDQLVQQFLPDLKRICPEMSENLFRNLIETNSFYGTFEYIMENMKLDDLINAFVNDIPIPSGGWIYNSHNILRQNLNDNSDYIYILEDVLPYIYCIYIGIY